MGGCIQINDERVDVQRWMAFGLKMSPFDCWWLGKLVTISFPLAEEECEVGVTVCECTRSELYRFTDIRNQLSAAKTDLRPAALNLFFIFY